MFVLIAYNLFRKRPKLKVVSYWCRIRCVIVVIQREKVEIAKPPTEAPIAGAIKKVGNDFIAGNFRAQCPVQRTAEARISTK